MGNVTKTATVNRNTTVNKRTLPGITGKCACIPFPLLGFSTSHHTGRSTTRATIFHRRSLTHLVDCICLVVSGSSNILTMGSVSDCSCFSWATTVVLFSLRAEDGQKKSPTYKQHTTVNESAPNFYDFFNGFTPSLEWQISHFYQYSLPH